MAGKGGLTERQRRFVREYAKCGNATAAARAAGYKCPDPQGRENLRKPTIAAALAELMAGREASDIATIEERQRFWSAVLRGEETQADMRDRLKASELLGKAQGDFTERHEHSGSVELLLTW
jgi:phage terminase small subunit